jgi:UDP-N-acetylmuramate dehydrogenase
MSIERVASALEELLPAAVSRDASVAELTTYRVGGPVGVLVRVDDERSLGLVAQVVASEQPPVLVVGRGSNLLVADRGFPAVAVVLGGAFEDCAVAADEAAVRAGGAVPLPVVARRSAAEGVGGLEFYVGIPGSVGGAVRMNAGGHGRETADVLRTTWVLDLLAGDAESAPLDAAQLDLSYRQSKLGPGAVVTRAELVGTHDRADVCEARIADIVKWRREHQPGGSNAGSVFCNPPGDSAGRLIDASGLKGFRVGGAVVSTKHANFFQAETGATADDVAGLVAAVRSRVVEVTGVLLEPELQMIGFEGVDELEVDRS